VPVLSHRQGEPADRRKYGISRREIDKPDGVEDAVSLRARRSSLLPGPALLKICKR